MQEQELRSAVGTLTAKNQEISQELSATQHLAHAYELEIDALKAHVARLETEVSNSKQSSMEHSSELGHLRNLVRTCPGIGFADVYQVRNMESQIGIFARLPDPVGVGIKLQETKSGIVVTHVVRR